MHGFKPFFIQYRYTTHNSLALFEKFSIQLIFRVNLNIQLRIELDNVDRLKSTYQSNYHIDFKN